MQRGLWSLLLCGASTLGLTGCMSLFVTHNVEKRTISSFIESLEKSDIEELKEVSSTDFKGSALRHSKAVEAFKMLNLPDGKVEVVEVKETSPDEKRVLVKVGEKQRKLYFDLVLDPKSKKWVVHDVEIKKNLKPGQVNKSVTEQMDLLLSIQEFLDAWESGDRGEILASSSPDLRKSLEPLPPQSLKQFAAKITTDLKRDGLKPEVEGHANMALIRVKRKGGEILVTMRLMDDKWLADDISVQSKKEEGVIPSIRKQTQVLLTAIRFCEAYQSGNKAELMKSSDPRFFKRVLQNADLSRVPLPIEKPEQEDYDIKLLATRAEVLVKRKTQILQLSLSQGALKLDAEGKVLNTEAETGKPFLVEEVTLHEIDTKQEKRLSAIYSSQSLVMVFASALANGDLKSLRFESTTDFQTRVWSRIELDDMAELPLEQIEAATPTILDTAFKGSITEVTVNQGATPLTYVLRQQNGRLLVDDVLVPALDRPNSLKMNLEVHIPLRNFAKGLRTGDMRLVRDHASREFNKLVFQSMNRIPKLRSDPAPFLVHSVKKAQVTTERALLVLGDEHYGATVYMNKEGDHYVIDDILMVSGLEQSQRMGLKQSLRQLVLSGTRFGNVAAKNPIVPRPLGESRESEPMVLESEQDAKSDIDSEFPDVERSTKSQNPRLKNRSAIRQTGFDEEPLATRADRSLRSTRSGNVQHADLSDAAADDLELEALLPPANRTPQREMAPSNRRQRLPQSRSTPDLDSSDALDDGLSLDAEGPANYRSPPDQGDDIDIDVIQPPK